jgi:eukaryotic-like serine/threonine-protein kinase
MGSVWEGTHATLGTHVAVKFIEAEYVESPEARSRFENEARAAARLRSKHVVEVYDHGLTEDGRPFIVMEYLRGEALDKRLQRLGRLPAKDTARVVSQVCRALSKAHASGIVHRDLKPENVFLVWDDEDGADVAKVVDFGIAKFTDNQLGSSSATRTGSVLGTPYYMSPEQARGLRSVDHRADLWSVGVIAYRCIVGSLPFDGEAVGDLLVKLCTAPLPIPSQLAPDVPPGFDAWFAKALSREPAGRFGSAAELAESLSAVCGLPGRSASATGDMASPGFASAHMPHGPSATSGWGGAVPTTPQPSAASDGSQLRGVVGSLPMLTGAPSTHTPGPSTAGTTGKGGMIALAATAVVVLGIGVGVLLNVIGSQATAADASAAPVPSPPGLSASAAPSASAPAVEAGPLTTAPAPSAVASTAPRPVAPAPAPAKPASVAPSRPVGQARPAAPAPPSADMGF